MTENTLLDRNAILEARPEQDKEAIIFEMADTLQKAGKITEILPFIDAVHAREAAGPTAVGFNLGLPHGRSSCVKQTALALARFSSPILWDIDTGETAQIVIMIAVPEETSPDTHLDLLASLSRQLVHEDFRHMLLTSSKEEILRNLNAVFERNTFDKT